MNKLIDTENQVMATRGEGAWGTGWGRGGAKKYSLVDRLSGDMRFSRRNIVNDTAVTVLGAGWGQSHQEDDIIIIEMCNHCNLHLKLIVNVNCT